MKKKHKDIIFLLLLFTGLAAGFFVSLGYPDRARLFPLIVISACAILVLVELKNAFWGFPRSESAVQTETRAAENQKGRKFAITTVWMGGFALMIGLLGFSIGLPLFIFAYLKTHGEGWLWTVVLPAAMFVIVYVGFGRLLESPLYEGLLFLN